MCSQAASLQVCWLRARKSTAWFKVTVQFFLRGIFACLLCARASQVALVVKNPPANARDVRDAGLIPGSGRSPGGGHGNPLQYSCLKNPMRSLAGCSSLGCKESDTTEAAQHTCARHHSGLWVLHREQILDSQIRERPLKRP